MDFLRRFRMTELLSQRYTSQLRISSLLHYL